MPDRRPIEIGFVYTLLMIMLMTVIHEFGHFAAAKLCGVKVDEFAVGMGPAIFKHQGKETLYSIRILPIGGYCKMDGEETRESDSPRAFFRAKVWKRFIIVISGALMNLLLGLIAIVISISCFYRLIPTTVVADFGTVTTEDGQRLDPLSNTEGGLRQYDKILRINGSRITNVNDITYILGICQDKTVSLTVERDGEIITLDSVPFNQLEYKGNKGLVRDFRVSGTEKSFFSVLDYSFKTAGSCVKLVYRTLGSLITGQVPLSGVSSVVGIGEVINEGVSKSESFAETVDMLLYYLYIISINLAVMNLLPFPALDGGHVVFLIYEAIFRKPVPEKLYTVLNAAGFLLIFGFALIIMTKDVIGLFI